MKNEKKNKCWYSGWQKRTTFTKRTSFDGSTCDWRRCGAGDKSTAPNNTNKLKHPTNSMIIHGQIARLLAHNWAIVRSDRRFYIVVNCVLLLFFVVVAVGSCCLLTTEILFVCDLCWNVGSNVQHVMSFANVNC